MNVMQSNYNSLLGMLEARRGYSGVDELLAWMNSDACDYATWPKIMQESLCKVPDDFRVYLAAPLANAIRDLSQGNKPAKDTVATLRTRMKRAAWGV